VHTERHAAERQQLIAADAVRDAWRVAHQLIDFVGGDLEIAIDIRGAPGAGAAASAP
jgi:hypothetical protein